MIKDAIIIYFVSGLILSLIAKALAARKNPKAFTPLDLIIDTWGVSLLFWPVLIAVSLIEIFGMKAVFAGRNEPPPEVPETISEGESGIAITPLKPSGKVRIGEKVVTALSDGKFIQPGTEIIVTGYSMSTVVVRNQKS